MIHMKEGNMRRAIALGLAVGLFVLSFAGLVLQVPIWFSWLDGIAALAACGGAVAFGASPRAGTAIWGALALGLIVLWLVGLRTVGAGLMSWGNFAFACAFLLLVASTTRAAVTWLRDDWA
jgi:hypothetical protein